MVTADEIRSIALSLPETEEHDHWEKPSFRVRSKIYAVIQPDGVVHISFFQAFLLLILKHQADLERHYEDPQKTDEPCDIHVAAGLI
ncbi:hypothetical protein ASG93_31665 [Paenibacillus sp. Soil787]|nr:MmcQ/YjbR family DNA-binding protein [Paenibacillus sp. Soil787]KRF20055.1 hypothetical protein ASG93_31665 [Paenibacillus sp. Soil787]